MEQPGIGSRTLLPERCTDWSSKGEALLHIAAFYRTGASRHGMTKQQAWTHLSCYSAKYPTSIYIYIYSYSTVVDGLHVYLA